MDILDTSDASAYAEDIAYGKIAYAREVQMMCGE